METPEKDSMEKRKKHVKLALRVQSDASLMSSIESLHIDESPIPSATEPTHQKKIKMLLDQAFSSTAEATESSKPKFMDNRYGYRDEFEYDRSGSNQGLVVIFNQRRFQKSNLQDRQGTNRDVNEIVQCLGRLGYNIDKENVFEDLTREEILDVLNALAGMDFSDHNSLIILYLSHGDENGLLHAKTGVLHTNEIWEPFSENESLKDKPKFFVFQACKGNCSSKVGSVNADIIPAISYKGSMDADTIVAYSTSEGSESYRNIFNGTWFIQEMCRNFLAYGHLEDVTSILIRTSKCVSRKYSTDDEDQNRIRKQMPLFVSTLTRKFYLTKSKSRNLVFEALDKSKELEEDLTRLMEKCDQIMKN